VEVLTALQSDDKSAGLANKVFPCVLRWSAVRGNDECVCEKLRILPLNPAIHTLISIDTSARLECLIPGKEITFQREKKLMLTNYAASFPVQLKQSDRHNCCCTNIIPAT